MQKERLSPVTAVAEVSPTHPPEVRSINSVWDATKYAKRYSQLPSFRKNFQTALSEDMRHLCREVVLQEEFIHWTEDISERGIEGNGYDEALTRMTQNYIAYCMKEFGDATRAITEHAVTKQIEAWALATAYEPGEYVIWLSAPGKEYGGVTSLDQPHQPEKFPTKVNVMWSEAVQDEATQRTRVMLKNIQMTGWPTLDQLVDVWEDLNQRPLPNHRRDELITDLIGQLTYLSDPRFSPTQVLERVAQVFYQTQQTWQYAQEMPAVPQEKFWQYENQLWQKFYLPKASRLLRQIPPNLPDEDPFWFSEPYQEIVAELDLLFQFFYLHLKNEVGLVNEGQPAFQDLRQNLRLLNAAFATDVAVKVHGEELAEAELDQHSFLVGALLAVGDRASSVTQCGVVGAFKIPLSAMSSSVAGSFGGGMSGNFGAFRGDAPSTMFIEKTQSKEYQEKWAEYQRIQSGNYQEVKLVVNGQLVYYMVPESFLAGKGCYVAEVDGQEVAMGPCDVPLNTVFADPNENLVYRMTASEFAAYTQSLFAYLYSDEFQQADQEINQTENLSAQEKEKAKKLLRKLEELVLPPMIGLSEFVSGFTPLASTAAFYLPGELLQQLRMSLNPLRFLEDFLAQWPELDSENSSPDLAWSPLLSATVFSMS